MHSGHPYIGRHGTVSPYVYRETRYRVSLINTNGLSRPEQHKLMLRLQLLEYAS